MIKKIALWGSLVILTGALAAGAIIRTSALTAGGEGSGQQRGQSSEVRGSGGGQGNGQSQGGNRRGQGLGGSRGKSQGSNSAEQAQDGNRGSERGQGQASSDSGEAVEWLAFDGIAASVDEDALIVALADGGEVIVEGRAWRYAQEQGFAASAGDPITLDGFYDEYDDFEVAYIRNDITQQAVTLREESGRPMWAGGGGRGNP